MPPTITDEGLRAAVEIREEYPQIAVLVLSAYVAESYVGDLLDSAYGTGVGYLLKDRVGHVREFLASVERVAAGGTVVDPRWCGSCCVAALTTVRSPRSPNASARCSR